MKRDTDSAAGSGQQWGWLVPVFTGVIGSAAVLLAAGTPALAVLEYAAYFALGVVLPGTLVHRLIAGFSETLLADVAWGAVTGLVLELAGWGLFTAAGINRFLWAWPAMVLLLFALVPRLRATWRRPAGSGRTAPVASWATAIATVLSAAYTAVTWYRSNPVPPSGAPYFVDLPWHLGVAHEATRTVVPQTPEATAEGILHYHWLPNAHLAAAHLISGVELHLVLTRLWVVPLTFVIVATTVALGTKVARSQWAGAMAGLLVVAASSGVEFWRWTFRIRAVYPDSTTSVFAVGIAALLVAVVVDVLRRERVSPSRLGLFALTLFVAVGSKPSVLPVLMCGLGLVFLVTLVRSRRLDWRALGLAAAMGVAVLSSLPLFVSSGGSTIDPLLVVRSLGGKTPERFAALLVVQLVVGYLLFFSAGIALIARRVRSDLAAVFLAGAVLGGFLISWVVAHPGRSQLFFWSAAVPFAAILTTWGLVAGFRAYGRRTAAIWFAAVASAAVLLGVVAVLHSSPSGPSLAFGTKTAVCVLVVVLLAGLVLRLPPLPTSLLAVCAALAMSLPAQLVASALPGGLAPTAQIPRGVDQLKAALWVEEHTALEAELATNSHCLDLAPTRPHCDARSFWLSGFGGRRVLLEGYGVSPSALRRTGVDNLFAWRQPYHDQALLALNDGAFAAPTREKLARLYTEHGVRWLVGDKTAGPVSAELERLAHLEYSNPSIEVYRLDPALLQGT